MVVAIAYDRVIMETGRPKSSMPVRRCRIFHATQRTSKINCRTPVMTYAARDVQLVPGCSAS